MQQRKRGEKEEKREKKMEKMNIKKGRKATGERSKRKS